MNAQKYSAIVQVGGKVELNLHDALEGSRVEIIVFLDDDSQGINVLVNASDSSTSFWDNDNDDQAWNQY